jgi:multidrug efflux pump
VLTLFTTPVIYLTFDRIAARMRSRRGGKSPGAELADSPT